MTGKDPPKAFGLDMKKAIPTMDNLANHSWIPFPIDVAI
jgi:hypothetical protein